MYYAGRYDQRDLHSINTIALEEMVGFSILPHFCKMNYSLLCGPIHSYQRK